ncbi:MAG: tryptophan synthase subunit alpha [Deltaproteobacteria bacterium]|nr:tryptophan synthase subunit alpha [Deltaproteobacteria bacterium]
MTSYRDQQHLSSMSNSQLISGLEVSRLHQEFLKRRANHQATLITYITAGDPDIVTSRAMALACVEGGADIIELGIPFANPVADGPVIRDADARALAAGTTISDCMSLAFDIRKSADVPVVMMGYFSTFHNIGIKNFMSRCEADAIIVPDLPAEKVKGFCQYAQANCINTVFLVTPTASPVRRRMAIAATTGFVYCVATSGVTGESKEVSPLLSMQVAAVRAETQMPTVIGFGISTGEKACALAKLADGVVIGSAIVRRIAEGGNIRERAKRVREFVGSLRRALDRG